jgi:hypothetical protein
MSDVRKPRPGKGQPPESSHKNRLIDTPILHDACQTDPDLAAVVETWPERPEVIRTGIVAMVKGASKSSHSALCRSVRGNA